MSDEEILGYTPAPFTPAVLPEMHPFQVVYHRVMGPEGDLVSATFYTVTGSFVLLMPAPAMESIGQQMIEHAKLAKMNLEIPDIPSDWLDK